jgi:hypothetical protein
LSERSKGKRRRGRRGRGGEVEEEEEERSKRKRRRGRRGRGGEVEEEEERSKRKRRRSRAAGRVVANQKNDSRPSIEHAIFFPLGALIDLISALRDRGRSPLASGRAGTIRTEGNRPRLPREDDSVDDDAAAATNADERRPAPEVGAAALGARTPLTPARGLETGADFMKRQGIEL